MEVTNKYMNNPLIVESDFNGNISYKLVTDDLMTEQDTVQLLKDSIPPKLTFSQIRNRNWYNEKKLLVGGSRYIEPKKDIQLVSSIELKINKFSLPIRERNNVNTDWLTIIFLVALALVA